MDEAIAALDRIPLFAGVERERITTERLGGLTNRNYKIECPAGNFVLRLAGEGTADYIDLVIAEAGHADYEIEAFGEAIPATRHDRALYDPARERILA